MGIEYHFFRLFFNVKKRKRPRMKNTAEALVKLRPRKFEKVERKNKRKQYLMNVFISDTDTAKLYVQFFRPLAQRQFS